MQENVLDGRVDQTFPNMSSKRLPQDRDISLALHHYESESVVGGPFTSWTFDIIHQPQDWPPLAV